MPAQNIFTRAWTLRSVLALVVALSFTIPGPDRVSAQVAGELPAITYSTFLASTNSDEVTGVAIAPDGTLVVAGATGGINFPVRNAFKPSGDYNGDGFVAKIDPRLSGDASLLFSTYIGGNAGGDHAVDGAVDASGFIYVMGVVRASDMPADTVILGGASGGGSDIFVMKLTPDGQPVYTTIVGGDNYDYGLDLAIDAAGAVYVAGYTYSSDFPTQNAIDANPAGEYPQEGFIFKLEPSGQSFEYSTYVGGTYSDSAWRIAVGPDGAAYVAAYTNSFDFPATRTFFPVHISGMSFAVLKLDPTGGFAWSNIFGATGGANAIAVNDQGQTILAGSTNGHNFPFVNATRTVVEGYSDAFVMKLDASDSTILFSSLLGSPGVDSVKALALAPGGEIVLAGNTDSFAYPTVNGLLPYHEVYPGAGYGSDGFVTVLGSDGHTLRFSTYLGGTDQELLKAVAVDAARRIYVVGSTSAMNFPIVNAFDGTLPNESSQHGFVTAISTTTSKPPPVILRFVELGQPGKKYRIRVEGENFQPGLLVYVGPDTIPWPNAKLTSKGIVLGSGRALKDRFPPDVGVSVRVVNPDGGSASLGLVR